MAFFRSILSAGSRRRNSFILLAITLAFASNANAASPDSLANRIQAFWDMTRQRLAAEPMEAVVTPTKEALPYHTYKVKLRGLNGVYFYAMMSVPVQGEAPAKPWPAIITTCGYGITAGQGIMLSECQRGYIIIQVYPRGQGISGELFKIEGDKLTSHGEQPDGAYYQGCYADMIRAIDFAMSRPDIDHSRIALMSTSQGGDICLAVAALDSRVKAVVAHVPFLCNMRLAATMPSLVKTVLDKGGKNNEKYLSTLDYFDPYQLAPAIRCPVFMSAGGKDVLCPQPTIQSVYNRLTCKKKIKIYPDLPHTTCLDFYKRRWPWVEKQLK
ncbi:prolyl oligopeptidase family serine peptidase [Pedobacter sp. BS3]|uniref:acetylxylan esterase n=1 Tax=Pedobacter sp. BS3 TaxID=2567937 RepID=UPI0011EBF3AE|nr:acetylxylan esterase [Pedobacter sp. BS3]TZF83273.1 prolyl oligopeptidase family serine peptidase [Pedobacter sp. BS3]